MSTKFAVSSLYQWPRHCTPKAREIVLDILNASQTPLATKDIYGLAAKPARKNAPAPPHAGEDIRSMRYLKRVVLQDLAARNVVEKVMVKGAFTAWLWRLKPTRPPSPSKPGPSTSTLVDSTAPTTAAVGVGADWSHLSKRRQRARGLKVERDVQRMLKVQKLQKDAVQQP